MSGAIPSRSSLQYLEHNVMRGALPTSDPGRPTVCKDIAAGGAGLVRVIIGADTGLYYVYELDLNRTRGAAPTA